MDHIDNMQPITHHTLKAILNLIKPNHSKFESIKYKQTKQLSLVILYI